MHPPKFTLRLNGSLVSNDQAHPLDDDPNFQLVANYQVDALNRSFGEQYEENLTDTIIRLEGEENFEWIGYGDDLPDLYGKVAQQEVNRGPGGDEQQDVFELPGNIQPRGGANQRGLFADIGVKFLQVFGRRAARNLKLARELGRRLDAHLCPVPKLFRVGLDGKLKEVGKIPTQSRALLILHGTISSFEGGFGGVPAHEWEKLHKTYNNQIFAYNHRTVTDSPVRNALDLLEELPEGLELDLITHSRGGLIGDVLARCDHRLGHLIGYTNDEIALLETDEKDGGSEAAIADEMRAINQLSPAKKLTIRRFVRVACPAQGTTLLSKRIDHFFNAALNLLKISVGPAAPVVGILREFIMHIVEQRTDQAVFPGLYAMTPESAFLKVNQAEHQELPSTLISIAGDSEVGGGIRQSLMVALTNLYYWRSNDFVVDTASMVRGMPRRQAHFSLSIESARIDHFSYFKVADYMKYVSTLLGAESIHGGLIDGQPLNNELLKPSHRGVVVDAVMRMGELKPETPSGDKPIVVLLPGIMGSNLYSNDQLTWMRAARLQKGALVKQLYFGADNVQADSAIAKYYEDLATHLAEASFDVSLFPFDWRLPLKDSAEKLHAHINDLKQLGQPIHFMAHSMGGLVVRQFMFDHYSTYKNLRENFGTRTILLGTPWRGSHLITEVITGHSKRIRQLHLLDLHHSKTKVLETVAAFPGVQQLLPLDDHDTVNAETWKAILDASGRKVPQLPKGFIEEVTGFRESVKNGLLKLKDEDYNSFIYVAGHHDHTVDGYELKYRSFWGKTVLKYIGTARGDGSVTWARGIPQQLSPKQVFYTQTQHGELASDKSLFAGLVDLLQLGTTSHSAFAKTPPVTAGKRGVAETNIPLTVNDQLISNLSPEDILFGLEEKSVSSSDQIPVKLQIFNGDLKWSAHPVVVGHFEDDGIVSAEKAIDMYLGGVLRERHQMGFYPGSIGEQEVIINTDKHPNGTVIVGLGDKDSLTGSLLTKTIEKGLLKYSLFYRDNKINPMQSVGEGHGISVLLIGSNYGELPLLESLRSIVSGVHGANALIESFNDRGPSQKEDRELLPITQVEFVDYYEDRAYEAHQILLTLQQNKEIGNVELAREITPGFGNRKRFLREGSRSWWQTMTTVLDFVDLSRPNEQDDFEKEVSTEKQEILRFNTSNRSSSVSIEEVFGNLPLARTMASQMSTLNTFNHDEAKVLFEMLIPNRYKDFIRNHRNLVWRMDRHSAQFPWELFHDHIAGMGNANGNAPTFVQAGMVRQLFSRTANVRPALVREKTALVIGDPQLGDASPFKQLPGAKAEAELAASKLSGSGFDVTVKINRNTTETVSALYAKPYRVIHIASHGVYKDAKGQTGIVLENDARITPGMLRQLSANPELVFVNACFLGEIDAKLEDLRLDRHRLAANIGTQLIENGVKAVVVAGWAVDDKAAEVFASKFYKGMLAGKYFGDAVRDARKACWESNRRSNTWGAYQCYGDQFYRLIQQEAPDDAEDDISLSQQVILELENLVSKLRNVRLMSEIDSVRKQASHILARAEKLNIASSAVYESEAILYMYLGNYTRAIQSFERLFQDDSGQYQVRSYIKMLGLKARHYASQAMSEAENMTIPDAEIELNGLVQQLSKSQLNDLGGTINTEKASIYKRAAALSNSPDQALAYLELSIQNYARSAKEHGLESPEAIYGISSVITFSAFAKTNPEAKVEELLGMHPRDHFKRWENPASYLVGIRNSPYALLREANLLQSKLIWELVVGKVDAVGKNGKIEKITEKELPDRVEELIDAHKRQRIKGFNLRDLLGQAEHYRILLRLLDVLDIGTAAQREQLQRLHTFAASDPSGGSIYLTNHKSKEEPAAKSTVLANAAPSPSANDGVSVAAEMNMPQFSKQSSVDTVFTKGFEKPADCTCSPQHSYCVEDTPSELLILSHKIDLSAPGTRGFEREETIRIEIPEEAQVALIELEDDEDEKFYAWVPLSQADSVRGFAVSGRYFEIQLSQPEVGERGLGKKLKNLFKKVKRVVVDFYRSAQGFVNKELRNNYNFQVLNLLGDGRVVYETVSGNRAFVEATQGADRSLLMLHGMFNTAKGTFKDLVNLDKTGKVEKRFGELLHQQYGGRALVMNMPTIFRSFQHNADTFPLDSVRAATLDVMANSRGTNVARELVTRLGQGGRPQRGQTFLAGGPAYGTPFADKDHMLSLVNTATTLLRAAGRPLGPVVPIMLHLVEQVASRVLSGEGLLDMAPGSVALQELNAKWDFEAKDVQFVGSNLEPTGSTKKLFGRLYDAELVDKAIMQGAPSDGVIPTAGALGLEELSSGFRSSKTRYRVPVKDEIGHFMYYQNDEVVERLVRQLMAGKDPLT